MTKKGLGSLLVGSCAGVFCVAVFGLFFYSAMNGYVSVTPLRPIGEVFASKQP